MAKGRIAVITDDPGWHGKRLREALEARGRQAEFLSLTECHFELDQGTKYNKSERMNIWEEAHRKTIGEMFERGLLKC